jgi:signal transduction histidine kinase/ActR/RegA family two-component response regulator
LGDRTNLRALLVTPNAEDAELAVGFLAEYSIAARTVRDVSELAHELPADAGCLILVEEALLDAEADALREALAAQPKWSDLPLVLIASHGTEMSTLLERTFPAAGNVTLLERPLNPLTLVSAVRTGLRARARQLEVHELLLERDRALRQRDDFLAMLAHELRNPLAPMRNAIWLQKQVPAPSSTLEKTRDIIDRQVSHLSRMVDDLLDVARLERGKVALRRQVVDLNAAVLAAIEACQPALQQRSHAVETRLVERALYVKADPVRLEQVFSNLLVNACKFTPEGGHIVVSTELREGTVIASVADNGIGIPAEQLESLFTPFVQGERSLARSSGGLGVGLSIARAIVHLHDGRITARSDGVNRGAVFEVTLPLIEAPKVAAPREAEPLAAGPSRRILVIEDNDDIRESLRLVLSSWGHEVVLSASGDAGLELALQTRPDVALIDIGLPGMNGYDVARQLRARMREWPTGIRLIAMTGYGAPADRERAANAGFMEHLVKPVDPEVLRPLLAHRA